MLQNPAMAEEITVRAVLVYLDTDVGQIGAGGRRTGQCGGELGYETMSDNGFGDKIESNSHTRWTRIWFRLKSDSDENRILVRIAFWNRRSHQASRAQDARHTGPRRRT